MQVVRALLFLSVACIAQDLPTARFLNGAFIGEPRGSAISNPGGLRIAVDAQGNRFTLQSVAELVQLDPPLYRVFAYVRKIAPDHAVVWVSRLEGKRLTGLALDPAGNVWVSGFDASLETSPAGFVTQISATGQVIRSAPIDGVPAGLAVDGQGSIYIAGTVNSGFRATAGAWKRDIGEFRCSRRGAPNFACPDGFAVKMSPDATRVVYATFLGGTQVESIMDIAVGSDGSAYIVGETTSEDFPVTPGAAQPRIGGVTNLGPLSFGDGFLVRLSPDGSRAIYSTYLGGPAGDRLSSVAVQQDGSAVVAGRTEDLLVMPGSTGDALIARFQPTGALVKQTKYGSPDTSEHGSGVALAGGRTFINLDGGSILELEASTLAPVRRAVPRVVGFRAIAASEPAILHVLAAGGTARTNIFAVRPGEQTAGAQYVARYDFEQRSKPAVTAIVNAASFTQGRRFGGGSISVAPGELITVFGEGFEQPLGVSLGRRPLDVIYADHQQINAVVPNDVAVGETRVSTEIKGETLGPWEAEVAPVVPGLFTFPCDPRLGPNCRTVAAINEDGTVNSMEHPAPRGSVVALFGTGLGALADDKPLRRLRQHLEAYGPGGPGGGMEILYAGEAPGVPGVQQVNVRIGEGPSSGVSWSTYIRLVFDLPTANGEMTQDNVRIFIR